jgi:hypothetical protein
MIEGLTFEVPEQASRALEPVEVVRAWVQVVPMCDLRTDTSAPVFAPAEAAEVGEYEAAGSSWAHLLRVEWRWSTVGVIVAPMVASLVLV